MNRNKLRKLMVISLLSLLMLTSIAAASAQSYLSVLVLVCREVGNETICQWEEVSSSRPATPGLSFEMPEDVATASR